MLDADDATQRGDRDRELIDESMIPGDEIGQIMRSRNQTVAESSIKQLHTLGPPRPFALVAHRHRHIGSSYASSDPVPCPARPGRC